MLSFLDFVGLKVFFLTNFSYYYKPLFSFKALSWLFFLSVELESALGLMEAWNDFLILGYNLCVFSDKCEATRNSI